MKTPRSTRTSFEFDRDIPAWLVRIEQDLRPLSIDLHKLRRLGVFDDFLRVAAKRRILDFFSQGLSVFRASSVRPSCSCRLRLSVWTSRLEVSRVTKWCGFS